MSDSTGFIVLGPYRSGTSVTAQVLHALGVNFGPKRHLIPAHDWNPGGHFERVDINNANDALIQSIGKTLADPGDPKELAERADRTAFRLADMSWTRKPGMWGIKDPRLCATLLAWLESGILDRNRIKIVHVRRQIAGAVKSAMQCPPVRSFCDGTDGGARRMLEGYAELAQWHVATLKLPVFTLDYEQLLKEPQASVQELAAFIGVSRDRQIRRATRIIGKGHGRFSLQMERLFIRGPKRLFRFMLGQDSLHWR
jgi:hypothetical protein